MSLHSVFCQPENSLDLSSLESSLLRSVQFIIQASYNGRVSVTSHQVCGFQS